MKKKTKVSARRISIPYTPRPLQAELHKQLTVHRWSVLVLHRRAGKTVMAVNHLLRDAVTCGHNMGRFAYIAPQFKQAKAVAWDYVKHFAGAIPGVRFNETELRCDLPNGARVMLLGAENPDALRGLALDGVCCDEYADMPESLFAEILRPALSDRQGYAIFLGTPRGYNAFYELYEAAKQPPDWYTTICKASETGILPQEELDAARSMMSPDQYEQEFEASWVANVEGSIFGAEMQKADEVGRITKVPVDPAARVNTAWDLGINDATSIWLYQQVGHAIHVIDYVEQRNEGLPYYVQLLEGKNHLWGRHYAPHDIEVRELGSGKSRREIAYALGIDFKVLPKLPVDDGIHNAQITLPRCYFDYERCKHGIEALRQYHRAYNDRTRVFGASPKRDWSTHGADAFRYMCLSVRDHEDFRRPTQPFADSSYNPFGSEVFA